MLTYHPAHDPYHSALRMLRIMAHDQKTNVYSRERLRILDFYVTFPELIADIRLPPKETKHRNRFRRLRNEYHFSGEPKLIFHQMGELQEAAIRLLLSTGMIEASDGGYSLDRSRLNGKIEELVSLNRERDREAVEYVVNTLGAIPVTGKNGLKARTGLMEFKYDAV